MVLSKNMTNPKRPRSTGTNGTPRLALLSLTLAVVAWLPSKVLTKTTNVAPGNGTLNTALTAADPGDVLQLEAGVYIGTETTKATGNSFTAGYLLNKSIVI